jgi:hypothetical protein
LQHELPALGVPAIVQTDRFTATKCLYTGPLPEPAFLIPDHVTPTKVRGTMLF